MYRVRDWLVSCFMPLVRLLASLGNLWEDGAFASDDWEYALRIGPIIFVNGYVGGYMDTMYAGIRWAKEPGRYIISMHDER